jgi:hypothetical protein
VDFFPATPQWPSPMENYPKLDGRRLFCRCCLIFAPRFAHHHPEQLSALLYSKLSWWCAGYFSFVWLNLVDRCALKNSLLWGHPATGQDSLNSQMWIVESVLMAAADFPNIRIASISHHHRLTIQVDRIVPPIFQHNPAPSIWVATHLLSTTSTSTSKWVFLNYFNF